MFHTKYKHCNPPPFHSDLPSAADPQYKEECDINYVVSRALRGSVPDHLVKPSGTYGDVSEYTDFAHMMDIVNRGTTAFMDVPSQIRARFGNDPSAFYKFVTDPSNSEELVKLGLAQFRTTEVEKPVKVEVVSAAATPKASA